MNLSLGLYLISCVVVVADERISHFNAGSETVCPGLDLRLDVLMVGDDQPSGRNIPAAVDRQTDSPKRGSDQTSVRWSHYSIRASSHLGLSWASICRLMPSIHSMRSRTMLKKRNFSTVSSRRSRRA